MWILEKSCLYVSTTTLVEILIAITFNLHTTLGGTELFYAFSVNSGTFSHDFRPCPPFSSPLGTLRNVIVDLFVVVLKISEDLFPFFFLVQTGNLLCSNFQFTLSPPFCCEPVQWLSKRNSVFVLKFPFSSCSYFSLFTRLSISLLRSDTFSFVSVCSELLTTAFFDSCFKILVRLSYHLCPLWYLLMVFSHSSWDFSGFLIRQAITN